MSLPKTAPVSHPRRHPLLETLRRISRTTLAVPLLSALGLLGLLAPIGTQAAPGELVPAFAPDADLGAILAATPDAAGRIVTLGATGVRRLDGTTGAVEPVSSFGLTLTGGTSLVSQTDGSLFVGGSFATLTHEPSATVFTQNRLIRLNPDATGTVDTSYVPTLNGPATTLARGAADRLYVGTNRNSGSAAALYRLLATGASDPAFTAPTGLATRLIAAHERSDGKLVTLHASGSSHYISLLTASGAYDPGFNSGASLWLSGASSVTAIAPLPDGRIAYVGNSSAPHQYVGFLLANGAPDTSFVFSGVLNSAPAGIAYRDGRLLVWGGFSTVNGQPRGGLLRLNLDGSLDSTFASGPAADTAIATVVPLPATNQLLVAGAFTTLQGQPRQRLALLADDVDISPIAFVTPRQEFTEPTTGGGSHTFTLRRHGPSTEAVSIDYSTEPATATASVGAAEPAVDYLSASGTVSWAAGDSADKTITVTLLADGATEPLRKDAFRIVLANPTGPASPAASAIVTIADVNAAVLFTTQPSPPATLTSGSSFVTLSAVTSSPSATTYQWFRDGQPIAGATSATFGSFTAAIEHNGIYTLVATNAAGSVTSSPVLVRVQPVPGALFPGQTGTGRPNFSAYATQVRAVLGLPVGGALIGGDFAASPANNVPRAHLLRVLESGATDPAFALTLNGPVNTLLRQPDGKILLGGDFTTVNGVARRRLARLHADLTLDTAFNTTLGDAPTDAGALTDFALDSTGRIYVSFNNTATGTIARFSATGVPDPAYAVLASHGTVGSPGGITALAVVASDHLVVAGLFDTIGPVGGTALAKTRVARLTPAGDPDPDFTANVGTMVVNDLLPYTFFVLAAGEYSGLAGPALLRIVTSTGATGSGPGSDIPNISGRFHRLAPIPEGWVVATGTTTNTSTVSRLSLLTSSTAGPNLTLSSSFTTTLGTGLATAARALDVGPDGSLWLAGPFANFNSANPALPGVVRLHGRYPSPAIINQPQATTPTAGQTATFSVQTFANTLPSYQWFKDGIPLADDARISGATSPRLAIATVGESDRGLYTVAVTSTTTPFIGGPAAPATITSAPARLRIAGAPEIDAEPIAPAGALFVYDALTLGATVFSTLPTTYQWFRDGAPVANSATVGGATTATLTFSSLTESHAGSYTLVATNSLGSTPTTPVVIVVNVGPDDRPETHRFLAASRFVGALLPLSDGRMLIGGSGSTNFTGGAGSTSASTTALALVGADGRLSLAGPSALNLNNTTASIGAILPLPDGKYLVGGSFTSIGGLSRTSLARLHADFTVDASFDCGLGTSGSISRLVLDAAGRIYVAGSFTNWGGISQSPGGPSRDRLVRLLPTGAFDATFTTQFNNTVIGVLPLADGRFLVAGTFTTPRPYVAALHADGTLDPGFAPDVTSYATGLALNPAADRLYICGGTPGSAYVRRYLLDGAADPGFTPPALSSFYVSGIAVQPDGKILAVGPFNAPGSTAPFALARLLPSGAYDPAFTVGSANYNLGNAGDVEIILDPAGRIWMSGAFTSATFPGGAANRLLVLAGDPALALDRQPLPRSVVLGGSTTFTATARGTAPVVTWQWHRNGVPLANDGRISGATTATLSITDLTEADSGDYTATAGAESLDSVTSAPARLTILAAPEIITPPVSQVADLGLPFTCAVTTRGAPTLTHQWLRDGVALPGQTTATLGLTVPTAADSGYYQLRVTNALGSATSAPACFAFAPIPGSPVVEFDQPRFSSNVTAVLHLPDGSSLVAGFFNQMVPPATFPGTPVFHRGLVRIRPDRTLDPAFAYFDGYISDVVRDAQGRFIVAGYFTSVTDPSGTSTRYSLARLLPDGALDTTWSSPLTARTDGIGALAIDASDRVIVGGAFTTSPGTTTQTLLRLDATTGAIDPSFASPFTTGSVAEVRVQPDGRLRVSGGMGTHLLEADGPLVPGTSYTDTFINTALELPGGDFLLGTSNGLRRITAAGAVLPHPSSNGRVNSLLRLPDGRIMLGGIFTGYDGQTARNIAVIDPDTGALAPPFDQNQNFKFESGFDAYVNCLVPDAQGRIWVGGAFTTYRGRSNPYLVVLHPASTLPSLDPGLPPLLVYERFLIDAAVPEPRRAATDDPDDDGISNLLEFALGLHPLAPDSDGLPLSTHDPVGNILALTYERVRPDQIIYMVETTTDLAAPASWTDTGVDQGVPAPDGVTTATVPLDAQTRFLRLRATLATP